MAGNIEGGRKAAERNKELYGENWYKRIGALGGLKSRGGGFEKDHELARIAGAKGGRASRRPKANVS